MATANLRYRVDDGPLLSESSTLAGGEKISLTASSFAGWGTSAALWEISGFPLDWPAPAGWSTDAVNERYYYRSNTGPSGVVPPDFYLPLPASIFGKWLFRVTVNGTIFSAVLGVKTRSPTLELDDIAYGESDQWGGPREWVEDQQDNVRKLEGAALAAGIPADAAYLLAGTVAPPELPFSVAVGATATTLAFENSGAQPAISVSRKAATGSVEDALPLYRTLTAGVGSAGTGLRVPAYLPDAAGLSAVAGAERVEATSVAGGVSAKRVWSTVALGVETDKLTMNPDGTLRLHGYAEGYSAFNASGDLSSLQLPLLQVGTTPTLLAGTHNTQNLSVTVSFYRNGAPPVYVTRGDAADDSVLPAFRVGRTHSGSAPVVGIGVELELAGQDDNGDDVPVGSISAEQTSVTAGAHAADLRFKAASAGALSTIGLWESNGDLTVTGSVTSGPNGFVGPQIDRATSGTFTLGSNITIVAGTSVAFTGVTAVVNAGGGLALSAGAGNASLTASGAINVGTSSATSVGIGRSGQTTTVFGDFSVAELTTIAGLLTRTNGSSSLKIDLQVASTTDATPTTVATLPVPSSGSVLVVTYFKGTQSDGSNGFQQLATNSARRSGVAAPTLSQGLSGIVIATLENTYAIVKPSIQFVLSGNNLLVQVVGKAATNINWAGALLYVTR